MPHQFVNQTKCIRITVIIIIISLFKVDNHTKKKKKTRKKIDVNLEHREHLATTQNNKKKSIVLIKVN